MRQPGRAVQAVPEGGPGRRCFTSSRWGEGVGAEMRAWGLLAWRFWCCWVQAGLPAWRLGLANTCVSWPPDAAALGGPREPTTRAVGETTKTARGA
jgi:hypothetical protein